MEAALDHHHQLVLLLGLQTVTHFLFSILPYRPHFSAEADSVAQGQEWG